MDANLEKALHDHISKMIEIGTKATPLPSPEEMMEAFRVMASAQDDEAENNPWLYRYYSLPSYTLDVNRDDSDEYFRSLTDAILAITGGDYGSIEYKGYKIYYSDTPQIRSISLEDGHKEYCYYVGFRCNALQTEYYEEYHSEDEKVAFLDPQNDQFKKTLALLDKEIELLDDGTWIKNKKTLGMFDFRDYSSNDREFKRIEWDDRMKEAADTYSCLSSVAFKQVRTKDLPFTEDDFNILTDVIRIMVFFADYGKRYSMVDLQEFIWYQWKPATKRDRYIWLCMDEFGQRDFPDRLINNCAIYYFVDDPQGWEAVAYLLPIIALLQMCNKYEPEDIKKLMMTVFDQVPNGDYRERTEELIAQDRLKAEKGESEYDEDDD